MTKAFFFIFIFSNLLLSYSLSGQTFGVIGDYGDNNKAEQKVSNLIKGWNPDFIITTGDNNYPEGDSLTIDENIGKYFHEFIHPYYGSYGRGSSINRFFPAIGNHDVLTANAKPYLDYFTLPNNERYYDFVWGNVHFFAINSNTGEEDGTTSSSIQAQWLKNKLASSSSNWKVVYLHESPYTSGNNHENEPHLQWPYKEWGATIVLSGHSHVYERLLINNFPYIINGLGGHSIYSFNEPLPGSLVRYNENFGAMKVVANSQSITFMFININDSLIDSYSIDIETGANNFLSDNIQLENYPNPFEFSSTITFTLPLSGSVVIKIYNLLGEEITTLISEDLKSGRHQVEWDAEHLEKGIYYYSLFYSNNILTRKAIIIK